MDVDALIAGLDAAQRHAVTTPSQLVAVIAGAGSGKTSVLSRRIAYRIATEAADPRHVLALTFTRQAAVELRNRLRSVGLRDDVGAGTFHAVALRIMRQRWVDQSRTAPTVVNDRLRLVREALGPERASTAAEIAAEIDWARARLIDAAGYPTAAALAGRRVRAGHASVATAYADLEVLKRRRGIIDLDDLLGVLLEAVRREPSFGDALRWRFRHLFVDEAQDLNPLQRAVLDVLRAGRDDLTLVGDPHQAVYGFNGADPGLLIGVEDRFPGVEVIRLDTNYRCTPQIVAAGASVLAHAHDANALQAARIDGALVKAHHFPDAAAEASGVAAQVQRWRPSGGRWKGIAVLARTNAQLGPLAAALNTSGIPTSVGRLDVRRALAEATQQPTSQRLAAWAHDLLRPALDADGSGSGDGDGLPSPRQDANALVAEAVMDFLHHEGGGDGAAFGDWVRVTNPFAALDPDAVELLTFHAAKGREWRRVIVTGVESGLVPHSSATTAGRKAEEVRLLYVALTRGQEEVIVTSAAHRNGRAAKPSPLLVNLPIGEPAVPPPPRRRTASPPPDPALERLDAWRRAAARAAGVAPHVICDDRMLAAIAAARPTTPAELAAVDGVSVLMADRLAPRILQALHGTSTESR